MISINRIKQILLVILSALLIVFTVIQFVQPARNEGGQISQTDILNTYDIPGNVHTLLRSACYDCHSNSTDYPWYCNIQPVGWLLAKDIKNGKAKLNFSEYGSLSSRRQISKLQEIENRIEDGTMPLPTYQLMHNNARLTKEDKELLIGWIEKLKDSITLKR
jgi:hypothetical protein